MAAADPPKHSVEHDLVAELINSRADIRLATMVGVGYLERYLQTFLVTALAHKFEGFDRERFEKRVLKQSLRNVSARVAFAEALGLFDSKVAADISLLLDIRNRFAHHISAVDASDPEILEMVSRMSSLNDVIEQRVAAGHPRLSPDDTLRCMIGATVTGLHHLLENPFESPSD